MQAKFLHELYYDTKNPAGLSSAQKLVDRSRLSPKIVLAWLEEQPTYTLHKPRRQNVKPLYSYRVYNPKVQYQADLVDYSKYAKWNEGFKFMLVMIDIFSKRRGLLLLNPRRGWKLPMP